MHRNLPREAAGGARFFCAALVAAAPQPVITPQVPPFVLMPSTPAEAHTRSVRSFMHREDAERARTALEDAGIASTIREYRVPGPLDGKLVTRALNLFVADKDATDAARIMLKLPPSEAPAGVVKPEGPSRLRRGGARTGPQKSSVFMILFAVVCAAGMIIYAATGLFSPKKQRTPVRKDNLVLQEDLNNDGSPDVIREFTPDRLPVHHSEDRNFDGEFDIRWLWQRGVPSTRDLDLNFDGKWDEHTVYGRDGMLHYTDTRPGGSGAVLLRRVFRAGIVWKVLEDQDADNHFDVLTEYDDLGDEVKKENLPKGHAENNLPPWPSPPWPPRDEDGVLIKP